MSCPKDMLTLSEKVASWGRFDAYRAMLIQRENNFCIYCLANIRTRAIAGTVLRLTNSARTADMIDLLNKSSNFNIYETSAYNVFRVDALKNVKNYVVSEYFNDNPNNILVGEVRNENLEALSFPDNCFDIVVNNDVLEHVANLDQSLAEIWRVLKPNGYHVFTVPTDFSMDHTIERARIIDGVVEHLREPVYHGDTIRDGILVFRDFGKDVLDYVGRSGFVSEEEKIYWGNIHIASVYYARKQL